MLLNLRFFYLKEYLISVEIKKNEPNKFNLMSLFSLKYYWGPIPLSKVRNY
jgi:hypothetical protein